MKRAVNYGRFLADVFHNVDLAASGPAGGTDIVAQHPKRRPDTLSIRNLEPRLKPSIGLRELIPGEQPCRSVIAGDVIRPRERFLYCFDHQQATLDVRVDRAVGISLEFVVTPAIAADIKGPLSRINRRAAGTIKLVTPHQTPYRGIAREYGRARG